jgi:hypothetical protein
MDEGIKKPRYLSGERGENHIQSHEAWSICREALPIHRQITGQTTTLYSREGHSLATQRAIVTEIEAEQALVAANRERLTRCEQKIQATLARIWGEEAPATPEA